MTNYGEPLFISAVIVSSLGWILALILLFMNQNRLRFFIGLVLFVFSAVAALIMLVRPELVWARFLYPH